MALLQPGGGLSPHNLPSNIPCNEHFQSLIFSSISADWTEETEPFSNISAVWLVTNGPHFHANSPKQKCNPKNPSDKTMWPSRRFEILLTPPGRSEWSVILSRVLAAVFTLITPVLLGQGIA